MVDISNLNRDCVCGLAVYNACYIALDLGHSIGMSSYIIMCVVYNRILDGTVGFVGHPCDLRIAFHDQEGERAGFERLVVKSLLTRKCHAALSGVVGVDDVVSARLSNDRLGSIAGYRFLLNGILDQCTVIVLRKVGEIPAPVLCCRNSLRIDLLTVSIEVNDDA